MCVVLNSRLLQYIFVYWDVLINREGSPAVASLNTPITISYMLLLFVTRNSHMTRVLTLTRRFSPSRCCSQVSVQQKLISFCKHENRHTESRRKHYRILVVCNCAGINEVDVLREFVCFQRSFFTVFSFVISHLNLLSEHQLLWK